MAKVTKPATQMGSLDGQHRPVAKAKTPRKADQMAQADHAAPKSTESGQMGGSTAQIFTDWASI